MKINGLKLLLGRDKSFTEFSKLEEYIKDLVKNAMIDFEFHRKVIIYKITGYNSGSHDSLSVTYLVCNESKKTQTYCGRHNELREYYVLESNHDYYVGMRNIFGQITHVDKKEYVFIDYDEKTHEFFKNFITNFHNLKSSLKEFFKEDKIKVNILNSQNTIKLLEI